MNKKKNYTVKEWIEIWMDTYKKDTIAASTYKNIRYVIDKHIVGNIGDMKIYQVKNIDCQRLINSLKDTPNTQNKVYVYLGDIFRHAVLNKLIPSTPAVCKVRKAKQVCSASLTHEEQIHLANYKFKDELLHYYYLFTLFSGTRRSESLMFNSKKDIKNGYINIHGTKNATASRDIPYFENIKKLLNEKPDLSFLSLKDGYVTRHIKEALPNHTVKDLRTTFATNCHEQGISPKVVQKWMGHKSLDMTLNRYTKVMKDFELKQAQLTNINLEN